MVDLAAERLLGAHVGKRAEHDVPFGDGGVFDLGHAKVENLRRSVGEEHDVRRLHVPMDDAVLVRLLQSTCDLEGNRDGVLARQRAAHEARLQRLAAVERHRDEQLPLGCLADLVNRADVGMIQRRGGAGFLKKAAFGLRPHAEVARQELQGDVPAEPLVERFVDHPHRAGAEGLEHAIPADGLSLPPEHRRARLRDHRREAGEKPVHHPRAVVRLEERFDLAAHIGVAAALPIEHGVQRSRVAVDRGGEDLLNTLPALRRHRAAGAACAISWLRPDDVA